MIFGIGTDILYMQHLREAVEQPDESFLAKTFTKKERDLICTRPTPLYSYATRFSGKEAVFKALRTDGNRIRLNEIEILEDENQAPIVILHGNALAYAKEKGIQQVLISLSYDTDYAIAYATACL